MIEVIVLTIVVCREAPATQCSLLLFHAVHYLVLVFWFASTPYSSIAISKASDDFCFW